MSLFHENIRQILLEVEKFLNETLKKESKLGKKTLEHKQLIIDKLVKFYEENPQLKPVSSQDSISVKEADDTSLSGRSEESEDANYIDAGIGLIAAVDLKDPVLAGFLEKKQKKGSGIFGGGKFQKRWCIVHGGNFYYYSNVKDKQQNGSFKLEGYKFRNAPDLSSKKAEKELCFELYHEYNGKRIYQFMAKNKTEYEEWQNVLENGGHPLIEEDIYEEVGAEEQPPATSPPSAIVPEQPTANVEVKVEEPPDGEMYEDPDSNLPPPPPPPSLKGLHKPPPSPVPKSPVMKPKVKEEVKPEPEAEVQDDLYDDASSVEPVKKDEPPNLRPPPPEPVDSSPQPPEVPPPPVKRSRPQRDLPPPPPDKKKIKLNITCKPQEDFENRYYGKWDCSGDCSNELSFKKGDIIYILSREFDEKAWWVGELNGKFGLVPKTFLTPAYTLVA